MLKAAIIGLNSESSKWIHEELKKRFDKADFYNLKQLFISFNHKERSMIYKNKVLDQYDVVYIRGSYKYKDFLSSIAAMIKGYTPIAPEGFQIMHNKLLTHIYLEQKGIPMPKTFVAPTITQAKEILKDIKYPVMIKFLEGTQGKGVVFLESYAAASSFLDSLEKEKQFIIQEHIDSNGEDIRVIVAGETVIAAMKRKAAPMEMRSNYHAGGSVHKVEVTPEMEKIAINAAKAVKADICGVDILETELGPLVIEVNASPGLQGITQATNINVAEKIANYLYEKALTLKKQERDIEARKILNELNQDNNKELILNLQLKAGKIVLPTIVSKITKFKDDEEVIISMNNKELTIKKFIHQ